MYAEAVGVALGGYCIGKGIENGLGRFASNIKVDLKSKDLGYNAAKYAVDQYMTLANRQLKVALPPTRYAHFRALPEHLAIIMIQMFSQTLAAPVLKLGRKFLLCQSC